MAWRWRSSGSKAREIGTALETATGQENIRRDTEDTAGTFTAGAKARTDLGGFYAALKRRSSTVLYAFVGFFATCGAMPIHRRFMKPALRQLGEDHGHGGDRCSLSAKDRVSQGG